MSQSPASQEIERLEALRRLELIDTAREPEFDELVELASALCETPIALLTLVDENRLWFKAAIGLELREVPRQGSFCDCVMQQKDLVMVEETTSDERTAQNPLVVGETGARFVAGVPVESPGGFVLGTLCVIDRVPRTLSGLQAEALKILGRQASQRLKLREERRTRESARASAEAAREAELQRYQAELEAANERLRELATTDPLTGLANRRSFDERLAAEFLGARRHHRALSVLMMDVDNFKERNDLFGHREGDATLSRVAELMRQAVRGSDLVVRYGGDEFLLLLPETDEAQAVQLAERILSAVRAESWPCAPVTMSAGTAAMSSETPDPSRLVSLADVAMYAAKRAGKDTVVGYSACGHQMLGGELPAQP